MRDAISDALRLVSGPHMYRGNAFRITGTPAAADRRAVRRQQQQVEVALKIGASPDCLGTDDARRVRMAFAVLLDDPQIRFVHELFCVWGVPVDCGCARQLHQRHDDAVRAHSEALDAETTVLAPADGSVRAELWEAARTGWTETLNTDGFWGHLRHRVLTLDDSRLGLSDIQALRDELPGALVAPMVSLAVANPLVSSHLVGLARTWPGQPDTVDRELGNQAAGLFREIDAALEEAYEFLDRGELATAVEKVRRDLVPLLHGLGALMPAGGHWRTATALDKAAALLNNSAVEATVPPSMRRTSGGMTTDVATALAWFREAVGLAHSADTRSLISENLRTTARSFRSSAAPTGASHGRELLATARLLWESGEIESAAHLLATSVVPSFSREATQSGVPGGSQGTSPELDEAADLLATCAADVLRERPRDAARAVEWLTAALTAVTTPERRDPLLRALFDARQMRDHQRVLNVPADSKLARQASDAQRLAVVPRTPGADAIFTTGAPPTPPSRPPSPHADVLARAARWAAAAQYGAAAEQVTRLLDRHGLEGANAERAAEVLTVCANGVLGRQKISQADVSAAVDWLTVAQGLAMSKDLRRDIKNQIVQARRRLR